MKKEINKTESKKILKKKRKLVLPKVFSLIFMTMFIVSLFSSIVTFADTLPFNIKEATISEKSENAEGDITSFSNDEVINNITFHKLNDYATYKLVIKSNLDKEVTILDITDDNSNPYLEYQYNKHENEKISAKSNFEFIVKAIYKNELTDITKRNQTNNVKFTIKYLEENQEKEGTIVINPKTGDNIHISYILLIISSTGLIVCIVLDKKRKNKKIAKVSVLIITGLVLSPVVTNAATMLFNMTFKTTVGIYDKMIVTYIVDGNEDTLINSYGKPITNLETPTKNGYTFTGWKYEDETSFDSTKPITEDIKIIATFTKDEYRISYDLNGGTTITANPTKYFVTDRIELINPTKEHYTFEGWTGTDLTEPTKNVIIENKTGNRSYTATYKPVDYEIKYDGLTDEEKVALNNPTKYNIETSTFSLTNPQDRVDSDGDKTEIFVGWKENTTTSQIINLPNLNSMGNKKFEAIWTPAEDNIYTITYILNDGTTATANKTQFTKKTNTFTLVNPEKIGYEFKGWSGTDLTGDENKVVKVEKGTRKSLTFEAHYTANNYQVQFVRNASDVEGTMSNQTLTYDLEDNLTINAYTRVGYKFAGWNTEENGSGTAYTDKAQVKNLTATKNGIVSLYAQWIPNTYKVEFNKNHNDAEGTMDIQTFTYDVETNLNKNTFTREHYKFMGWSLTPDGSVTYQDEEEVKNLSTDGTLTLYAQWKERTATLQTGANVNSALRTISTDATKFKHYDGNNLPNFDTYDGEEIISTEDSNFPVYVWVDDDTIYWWSEAEYPKMNANSSGLFNGKTDLGQNKYEDNSLKKLESIDMTGIDVSTTVNMSRMFKNDTALTTLNLGDFNALSATNMSEMFANTTNLRTLDLSNFNSPAATNMSSMFSSSGITSIDLSQIESQNVTNMSSMFSGVKMDSLDASKLNTVAAKNMSSMFQGAKVTTLSFYNTENPSATLFKTDSVTDMTYMFRSTNTTSLDLSKFNTSKVQSFMGTFYGSPVSSLDISTWNTESATNMNIMFFQANRLTSLDLRHFNTKNVTTMQQMFDETTKLAYLDVSGWTNDKVTNMSYMFKDVGRGGASNVEIVLTNFMTPAVTSMGNMFSRYNDGALKTLDLSSFDTSNVKNMNTMFGGGYQVSVGTHDTKIQTIYVSDKFVTTKVDPASELFNNTSTIIGGASTAWNLDNRTADMARIDDPDSGRPGYFSIKNARYIRYNGNGADNSEYETMTSHYLTNSGSLKANAFVKDGYKFMGWNTKEDGSGDTYTDEQLMSDLTESKTPLTLYAQWKELSSTLNHGNSIQTTLNDISSTATAFIRYNGTPDWNNIQNRKTISTQSSEFPVYAWLGDDGETIYWWSEVPHPKLNADSSKMFNGMSTLKTIEISDFDASNVTNMGVMFNGCSSLEELDINGWNTASVRNMTSMFGGCQKLEDDDLESIQANLNTSNVTSMNAMFQGCTSLVNIELDNFDTGNVKDMAGMFKNCTNAKSIDLSNFNTKELTTVRTSSQASMFEGCTSLESIDVSGWTNEKLTDMGNMFSNLSNVKHINLTNFKTDNVTNMSRMFDSSIKLESLDVSSFNTSKVTSMMQMFFGHKYDVLDLSNFDFHSLEKCGAYGGSNVIIEYGSIKKVYLGKIDASSIAGGSIGFGGRNVATTKFYINDDSDVNIQSFIDSNGDIGFNGIVTGQNGTKVSDHGAKNYEYYRIDDPDNGKPGYFWKRNSQYIRYNGNGADNSEYETMTSHYLDNTGSLKKNAFARAGYTFTGWNTKADGSGDSYTDEQLMSNIVEANTTTPLTLYAQWNEEE